MFIRPSPVSVRTHDDAEAAPLCVRLLAGDPIVIEVWGELRTGTGHLLIEFVEHVLRGEPSTVVLDLSHARSLPADGDEVLGLAAAMIVAAGSRVSVFGVSRRAEARTGGRSL